MTDSGRFGESFPSAKYIITKGSLFQYSKFERGNQMDCTEKVEKVIGFYLTELYGEDTYELNEPYREASEAYKRHLAKAAERMDYESGNALDLAVSDLLAQTEKLAFRDGFIAGAGHMKGLENVIDGVAMPED